MKKEREDCYNNSIKVKGRLNEEQNDIFEELKSLDNYDELNIVVSDKVIPKLFYNISKGYSGICKIIESVTTIFGYGLIVFTLIYITYFCFFGEIPFNIINEPGISGINSLGFVVGIITGVVSHEFAHGIVLANNKINIKRVGIMAGGFIGCFIEADEETFFQRENKVHIRFNATGIGVNALIATIFIIIGILTSSDLIKLFALGNLFFGFINAFPVTPLDGGWVFEGLLDLYVTNNKTKTILQFSRYAILILWVIIFTCSALFNYS